MRSTDEEKAVLSVSLKAALERKRQRDQEEVELIEMAFNRIKRINPMPHQILDSVILK